MIRKLFIISLAWAIIILILSGIPGDDLPKHTFFNIPNLDKWIHALLYFPLAVFISAEFNLSKKLFWIISGPFLTMFIVAVYGGGIEFAQKYIFIHRSADPIDFLFDILGGLFGIAFYFLFLQSWFKRLSSKS